MTSKAVALYVRVSTCEQTVSAQVDALNAWAAARGGDAKLYADEGVSGAKDSRPALDAMLRDARLGVISTVAVAKLDRLGRSLKHLLAVVEELDLLGVGLVSLDLGVDTRSATGRLMLSIVGAMAAFERELLIERTRAGMAAAKRRGVHCGRKQATSGEQRDRIARLLRSGHTVREIAKLLDLPRSTVGDIVRAVRTTQRAA
jgi:DNA invertase Pin-like site-specific DNA recombinase